MSKKIDSREDNVVKALMHLFKIYMAQGGEGAFEEESMLQQLWDAGFTPSAVLHAFGWMQALQDGQASPPTPSVEGFRVFSEFERDVIPDNARDFIADLEARDILAPPMRELVLSLLLCFDGEEVDIHLTKWVTLMVLSGQDGEYSHELAQLECLVFGGTQTTEWKQA